MKKDGLQHLERKLNKRKLAIMFRGKIIRVPRKKKKKTRRKKRQKEESKRPGVSLLGEKSMYAQVRLDAPLGFLRFPLNSFPCFLTEIVIGN